jgi:hypothetical protein
VDTTIGTTARTEVAAWLSANSARLGWNHVETKLIDVPAATLAALYRTTRHFISITVWDHAFCMEILVLNASTGEQLHCDDGCHENSQYLLNRLAEFEAWLARAETAA